MEALANREAGIMAEEPLFSMGHQAALSYAANHPIGREVWPNELRDEIRERIDVIVLRLIGVPEDRIRRTRERMVNELVAHTRKLRLLELEAQINRQGSSSGMGISPRQLANEIWNQLITSGQLVIRRVPEEFLGDIRDVITINLPGGRVEIEQPNLFSADRMFTAKIGNNTIFRGPSEQVTYLAMLSSWGVTGDIGIPSDLPMCREVLQRIEVYREEFSTRFDQSIVEITSDVELQSRILREGWKRSIMRN
jgi:hypothetical protein